MTNEANKPKKLGKGMPSAVVLSIAIHAVARDNYIYPSTTTIWS